MTTRLVAFVSVTHLVACVMDRAAGRIPLVVATSRSDRGIVVDVNVAASSVGLHNGMSVFQARRRCSELHVVTVDRRAVAAATKQIERTLAAFGDGVQRMGGGWTLTLGALGIGYCDAEAIVQQLRAAITLPTTVGLAVGPRIARIAACHAPHAICCVLPGDEAAFLAPLAVEVLPGIGERAHEQLARLGVTTVGQVKELPVSVLRQVCGNRADGIIRLAHGIDGDAKRSRTTCEATWEANDEPCADHRQLRAHLHALTAQVGRELRLQGDAAGQLSVAVAWVDGFRHQYTLRDTRRDLDDGLHAWSREALRVLIAERRIAVRSLSVMLGDLGPRQSDLFSIDDTRPRQLQDALDMLARRYGPTTILPATLIGSLG